jgi:hypothetical protein
MAERHYGAGQGNPTGWTLDQLQNGLPGMKRDYVAVCCFTDFITEIKRLRAVILDIARIVENPDDRALQRVRDVTDKHSSDSAPREES